jgi:hypothetical protein
MYVEEGNPTYKLRYFPLEQVYDTKYWTLVNLTGLINSP